MLHPLPNVYISRLLMEPFQVVKNRIIASSVKRMLKICSTRLHARPRPCTHNILTYLPTILYIFDGDAVMRKSFKVRIKDESGW